MYLRAVFAALVRYFPHPLRFYQRLRLAGRLAANALRIRSAVTISARRFHACGWCALAGVRAYLVNPISNNVWRLACRPCGRAGYRAPLKSKHGRRPCGLVLAYLRKSALNSANVGKAAPALPALNTLIFASVAASTLAAPSRSIFAYSWPLASVAVTWRTL